MDLAPTASIEEIWNAWLSRSPYLTRWEQLYLSIPLDEDLTSSGGWR